MSYARYAAIVAAVFAITGTAIIGFGVSSDPYVGDLTRLGGYSESAFAWTAPQQRFAPPLYHVDDLEPGSDVLVLGDSMTLHRPGEQTDDGTYWPNWLHDMTGWTISALHRHDWLIDEVMALPEYRAAPPKLLVLEFPERGITVLNRLIEAPADLQCSPPAAPDTRAASGDAPLSYDAQHRSAQIFLEPRPQSSWLGLSLGGHRLKHFLLRQLAPWSVPAVPFALQGPRLFSSRESRVLLVYRDDLLKRGLGEAAFERHRCALANLRDRIEADGRTRLMLLVVPDKLSTYRPHIVDFPSDYPAVIAELARDRSLLLPRVDLAFESALRNGVIDLFMPNDTHPGYAGHRLIAETVLRELEAQGLATPR